MLSIVKNGVAIHSVSEWREFAPPQNPERQWKENHSARAFAEYATSDKFPALIARLLAKCGITMQGFKCEPEAITPFPENCFGKNGPRHHDLLMVGEDCVIGVEAKVSERFGKRISQEAENASENKRKRVLGLVNYLEGTSFNEIVFPADIKDLRYQLFTATVGTIIAAKNAGKTTAIVLLLSLNMSSKSSGNRHDAEAFRLRYFKQGVIIREGVTCHLMYVVS